jgi:5-enolpyruvylshikimate-3-phosphate synthase
LPRDSATVRPQLTVSGAVSSQFVSAMLFSLRRSWGATRRGRRHRGAENRGPQVDTTLEVMRQAGVNVESSADALRPSRARRREFELEFAKAAPGYRARASGS